MEFFFPVGKFSGYGSFILAFEFAENIQDIHLLLQTFSIEDIQNIDKGNYFDFGFMATYSTLLGYLYYKSAKIFNKKWLLLGIPLAIIIFSSDFIENIILLKITNIYVTNLNESIMDSLLAKLHVITWVKWGGLAFTFFIFYEVLYRLHWFYKITGPICLLPFLYIIITGEFSAKEITFFALSIAASFIVLIVFGLSYKKGSLVSDKH